MNKPAVDQLELTVIGPGFGECILIHVGNDNWLIVDSCIPKGSSSPAPLEYLDRLGVGPDSVQLIVCTHWHSDHTAGISDVVRTCKKADVCLSPVFDNRQLITHAALLSQDTDLSISSPLEEFYEINLIRVSEAKRPLRSFLFAGENKTVLRRSGLAHGHSVEVTTLSPSDRQLRLFIEQLLNLVPKETTLHRMPTITPNGSSVVCWVEVGKIAFLLGADLEEVGSQGWSAIVRNSNRPPGRAGFFKIPHHGSENAHCDPVWGTMLVGEPGCVLTPYNLGYKLPTKAQVEKLLTLTPNGYTTSNVAVSTPRRNRVVEKTLKDIGNPIKPRGFRAGRVTWRNKGPNGFDEWMVDLETPAVSFDEMLLTM